MRLNQLLSSEQLTSDLLFELFEKADAMHEGVYDCLKGKIIATVFFESSTRTRLSFESAVLRLGGSILSTENAKEMSSAIKGETLMDTLRVIQSYADIVIVRHGHNTELLEVAKNLYPMKIINAGAGSGEHPTQALLDTYTIYRKYNRLNNLKICVVGDLLFGRTIHSLVKVISQFENITIYGVSPDLLHLPQEYVEYIEKNGATYTKCNNIHEVPDDIDVMYCTRTQSERFKDVKEVQEIVVNLKTLERFKNVIVMHPLPRNSEIAPEVDGDPRAVYFEQAKNGMYARMALLEYLIKEV